MTVRLSPHKVSKILRGYFYGLPQKKIAREVGVDQSSISHYATRFKDIADQYGILAAGKEYGVHNEVESLRSLSVELYQSKLTVEEARKGHDIIKAFLKLGISTDKHLDLIQVCKKIGDPGFIDAVLKLSRIEVRTGKSYQQVMSGFEDALIRLPQLEEKIFNKQSELKSLNGEISQKEKDLTSQRESLKKCKSEAKSKESQMDKELSKKMKQMDVKVKEVDEFAALKKVLTQKGLNLDTILKLAKEF